MNQSSLPNYIKKLRTINLKTKLYKNITIKKLKKMNILFSFNINKQIILKNLHIKQIHNY